MRKLTEQYFGKTSLHKKTLHKYYTELTTKSIQLFLLTISHSKTYRKCTMKISNKTKKE